MDNKTNQQVLKCLLEINKEKFVHFPIQEIKSIIPILEESIIEATLQDLESYGIIDISYADDTMFNLCLTHRAIGYFRELAEEEEQLKLIAKRNNREKWLDRLYGFISGVAVTVVADIISTSLR